MRLYPAVGDLFDVGGGNGSVALAIQQAGHSVVLLEPGVDAARRALERGVSRVICSTLENARLHESSVPAAGLFDVIEHVEDDRRFLQSLWSRLVPGGRLYLTVPASPVLWSFDDEFAKHFRRYRRKDLDRLLAETGFHTEYVSHFFSILAPAILVRRSFPTWLGLRRRVRRDAEIRAHQPRSRGVVPALDAFSRWEVSRIERGLGLPIGSSLVAVARKVDAPASH